MSCRPYGDTYTSDTPDIAVPPNVIMVEVMDGLNEKTLRHFKSGMKASEVKASISRLRSGTLARMEGRKESTIYEGDTYLPDGLYRFRPHVSAHRADTDSFTNTYLNPCVVM